MPLARIDLAWNIFKKPFKFLKMLGYSQICLDAIALCKPYLPLLDAWRVLSHH